MKTWFTSDWHLGDDRLGLKNKPNVFYRPFTSIQHQNKTILKGMDVFSDGDILWHLGDVLYDLNSVGSLEALRAEFPNSKFNLIIGNYDLDKTDILEKYFDTMQHNDVIDIKGRRYYMDHYPKNCFKVKHDVFSLTGHIHGLWKVQKNMINVGVDAWHFKPVSEDEIDFCRTACEKYYDENVFPY